MTNSGVAGLVLLVLVVSLVLFGLIGGLVWVYSAQSAKRRRSGPGGRQE